MCAVSTRSVQIETLEHSVYAFKNTGWPDVGILFCFSYRVLEDETIVEETWDHQTVHKWRDDVPRMRTNSIMRMTPCTGQQLLEEEDDDDASVSLSGGCTLYTEPRSLRPHNDRSVVPPLPCSTTSRTTFLTITLTFLLHTQTHTHTLYQNRRTSVGSPARTRSYRTANQNVRRVRPKRGGADELFIDYIIFI